MKLIKNFELKFIFLFFIFLLALFKYFNTPYNIYSILIWDYEKRMEYEYGFCKNHSWGFYNLIDKKFNLKKEDITIKNDEGFVTLEPLFDFTKNLDGDKTQYAIILNYQSENNEDIYSSKYDFIKNYKIKFRYNNCYLMELND